MDVRFRPLRFQSPVFLRGIRNRADENQKGILMKAKNWLKWCLAGLLAIGCSWMTLGCDDDDEEDAALDPTVEASSAAVPDLEETDSPNDDVAADQPADEPIVELDDPVEDADAPPLVWRLLAPTLVAPANGKLYEIEPNVVLMFVKLEWTAVSGAALYVYEVDGVKHFTDATSKLAGFSEGTHTWRVWGRMANNVDGWPSATRTFTIKINR